VKLDADISRLSTAAGNDDSPAVLAACQQMLTDVQAAQSAPVVSDPALASDWTKVLDDYSAGATDCVSAAKNSDSSLVDRARSEVVQGSADATKLGNALEKLANSS
jgi:hypothetical protein